MMVEVKVQSLGLDRKTNNPVVILRETGGDRVLPIWIGPGEASAIAIHLAGMVFPRPLTHDLLTSVVRQLGGTLRRVLITKMVEDTYFAELVVHQGDTIHTVDARPSDSIALALRSHARIFADDALLEYADIEVSQEPEDELEPPAQDPGRASDAPIRMDPEALKEYLRTLNPEDFGRFTP